MKKVREMITLHIDFQEGFLDDSVIIKVNQKEVFKEEHITTLMLTGLAKYFTVLIESGLVSIDVILEKRRVNGSITYEIKSDKYVGISVLNQKINFLITDKSFFYG